MNTSAKEKAPINRGLFRDYDIQKDSEMNMRQVTLLNTIPISYSQFLQWNIEKKSP